jgi:hypothetical protein
MGMLSFGSVSSRNKFLRFVKTELIDNGDRFMPSSIPDQLSKFKKFKKLPPLETGLKIDLKVE